MKIVIAHHQPIILYGTKIYLEILGYNVEGTCDNGDEVMDLIRTSKPDVAVLDFGITGLSAPQIATIAKQDGLSVKIILLATASDWQNNNNLLKDNVYGFLLNDISNDEIDDCLVEIESGKRYTSKHLLKIPLLNEREKLLELLNKLNDTEQRIIQLMVAQNSTQQISEQLFMPVGTVKLHKSNISAILNLPPGEEALDSWILNNHKNT
ncbi:MAG: response regulator transcription factor [Bacteroidia bacterium]|nr:response regulator transcription factor [Bacteroidia bacterium]